MVIGIKVEMIIMTLFGIIALATKTWRHFSELQKSKELARQGVSKQLSSRAVKQ